MLISCHTRPIAWCFSALFAAGLCGCIREVVPADYEVLVTARDFIDRGLELADCANCVQQSSIRNIDGTVTVNYTYQGVRDTAYDYLFIQEELMVSSSKYPARQSLKIQSKVYRASLKLFGKVVAHDTVMGEFGDEHRFAVLYRDSLPVGNLFHCRIGGRVLHLLLLGIYFADADVWRDLVAPKLEALESYKP